MGQCSSNETTHQHQLQASQFKPMRRTFNPFYEQNTQQSNQQAVLSGYKFHSHYSDKYLGECDILEEKISGDLFLCKELQFSKEDQFKRKLDQLNTRKNLLVHQNIIQIKDVLNKSTDGVFTQYKKILIILDYPFVNMQRELANRALNKLPFTKQEFYNMSASAIKGYSAIEKSGFRNDKVRLRNMFIGIKNKEPLLKVAQTTLISTDSNLQSIMKNGADSRENYDIFLAPQQIQSLKFDQENRYPDKSGVFSLGMSLLQLGTRNPSRQMYHYDQYQIDMVDVNNRIGIVGKQYGGYYEKLLKDMLLVDARRRPSFPQLENRLPKLFKNENDASGMHVSVVPNRQSSYLKNSSSKRKGSHDQSLSPGSSRVFSSRVRTEKQSIILQEANQEYTNGNRYIGTKKNGLKHGKGKYMFKDGSYYEGNWKNNKMQGKGDLFFRDGRVEYQGQWSNDQFDGWGILNSFEDNWTSYQGQFKNGIKDGRGKMQFKNGDCYDGDFKGNKIHGYGRLIHRDGSVEQKYWEATNPDKML